MSPAPNVFDRALLTRRRRRAAALAPVTFLVDRVTPELSDRLSAVLQVLYLIFNEGYAASSGRQLRRAELTRNVPIPEPPFWGPRTIARVPAKAVVPYLNERMLYQFQWGYRKDGKSLRFVCFLSLRSALVGRLLAHISP